MPRTYYINGPAMVIARGGQHLELLNPADPNTTLARRQELGLTSEPIRVTANFYHRDIRSDSFGPDVPQEVMWNLADATIQMDLIHFDRSAVSRCVREAAAGGFLFNPPGGEMVALSPASALLGNGLPLYASGNHFMELAISSPVALVPWVFPSAYLYQTPLEFPLGTGASAFRLNWRAIAYRQLFNPASPPTSGFPAQDGRSADTDLWHHFFNV